MPCKFFKIPGSTRTRKGSSLTLIMGYLHQTLGKTLALAWRCSCWTSHYARDLGKLLLARAPPTISIYQTETTRRPLGTTTNNPPRMTKNRLEKTMNLNVRATARKTCEFNFSMRNLRTWTLNLNFWSLEVEGGTNYPRKSRVFVEEGGRKASYAAVLGSDQIRAILINFNLGVWEHE